MKKRVMMLAFILLLVVGGCEGFWMAAADPNSSQNVTVSRIGEIAEAAKESAPLFGPAAIPVATIATAITALIGVYNNKRKKLTITGQNVLLNSQGLAFNKVQETTRAIVEAIEAVDDAVSHPVKDEIKKKLQEHEIYKTGKAIISGLKA